MDCDLGKSFPKKDTYQPLDTYLIEVVWYQNDGGQLSLIFLLSLWCYIPLFNPLYGNGSRKPLSLEEFDRYGNKAISFHWDQAVKKKLKDPNDCPNIETKQVGFC